MKNPETETSHKKITAKVTLTEGSYSNIKITTREDLPMEFRAGSGYDVHRLAEGRKLILCGYVGRMICESVAPLPPGC